MIDTMEWHHQHGQRHCLINNNTCISIINEYCLVLTQNDLGIITDEIILAKSDDIEHLEKLANDLFLILCKEKIR